MEKKNSFVKGALCGALAMLLTVCVIGSGVFAVSILIRSGRITDRSTEKKLKEIESMIDQKYLYTDEIEKEDLKDSLVKGYVAGLGDPYSVYYTKEEMKDMVESIQGEFSGIGVALIQDPVNKKIIFVNVYEEGAAAAAGFQVNDILYKVNDEDVTGQDLDKVVTKIRGEEGTEVKVTVLRGENSEEFSAPMTRKKVEAHTVEHEMLEDGIGYIYISEFSTVTYEQLKQALEDIQKQNAEGIVFDLRGNPGGNLDTVCDILDLILPEGTIVYTENKDGKRETMKSDEEHKLEIPMTVLVDENSASASEIFAGAVQDYGIGKLVGTTTFGKGIVQHIYQMGDGTGIKLTTEEYFTPNGRNIHGTGIAPDVEVEYVYNEEDETADNQLEKAIEVVKEEIGK